MAKVIYKKEIGVNTLGELENTVLPTCPVCGEVTYSEDTCPFCRKNGLLTELEYDGAKSPKFFEEKGTEAKCHCGACMKIVTDWDDDTLLNC